MCVMRDEASRFARLIQSSGRADGTAFVTLPSSRCRSNLPTLPLHFPLLFLVFHRSNSPTTMEAIAVARASTVAAMLLLMALCLTASSVDARDGASPILYCCFASLRFASSLRFDVQNNSCKATNGPDFFRT